MKTVPTLFRQTCEKYGDKTAIVYHSKGIQYEKTWKQFYNDCCYLGEALISMGLNPGRAVMIQGFNSYQWFVSHLATIMAGGISAGVYTTNKEDVCDYLVKDSKAQFVIVENEKHLNKYNLSDENVKYIIWDSNEDLPDNIHHWSEILEYGKQITMCHLGQRMSDQDPRDINSLIYTSGTTGMPKGVQITHDNATWTAKKIVVQLGLCPEERVVSYLPLSHIAAQMLDIYGPMTFGGTVYIAQPDALKGSLVKTLNEAKPTIFFGVPRVWQKFQEKMLAKGRETKGLKKKIAKYAKKVGLKNVKADKKSLTFKLMNKIVYSKVKKALGLDKCKVFVTGAAPISPEVLDYFASLNIKILNVYGASESSGPATITSYDDFKMYNGERRVSCGKPFDGSEVKIASPDAEGNGEILFRGRHIFKGYLNKQDKTNESFTEDGFYRTGDVGKFEDGRLYITGRIKELLITSGGENVAPVLIENSIKKELPNLVSNVVVVGDNRKYLTCLITLKCEQDMETMKMTRVLQPQARDEVECKTSDQAMHDDKTLKLIADGIGRANENAVSNAQTVKKFKIIPDDFGVETEELTPTMKVKRNVVYEKYHDLIENMYT